MDKRYARSWWAVVLFLVVFLSTSTIRRCGKNTYRYDEGLIFGTFYHITYKYPESLSEEIKNRLLQFDARFLRLTILLLFRGLIATNRSRPTGGSSMCSMLRSVYTHARVGRSTLPYLRLSMHGDSVLKKGLFPILFRSIACCGKWV